jgi:glycosyltransferase involved in cell wall biosynthesis
MTSDALPNPTSPGPPGGARKPLYTTYPFPTSPWRRSADFLPQGASGLERVRRVVAAAKTHRVLVLNGFSRHDMIAAGWIARRRRRPAVLVLDPTWKPGTNPVDRALTRFSVRLLDGEHVRYGVLTRYEVGTFPRTWKVSAERVRFIPWFCTLAAEELQAPVSHGGGFFAGGNSLRDFDTLIEAAAAVPAAVTIASNTLTEDQLRRLPDNVSAGPVSPGRYDELSRSATAVVLPLEERPDRTSGQGTLLAAMALGKTLIVNDAPGVRDYVRPDETALVVPSRDPDALARAMRWVIEHPDRSRELGARARDEASRHYTAEAYAGRVMHVAMDLLE